MTALPRLPILLGAAMGAVMPWLMHIDGGGIVFILAHLAVLGAMVAATRFFPRLRHRLHRPSPAHVAAMGVPAVLAWGATCLICLALDGTHWS